MKRPSFQFYPGDWTQNSNLRRCSHAEKGVWVDVLCLMHDQEEYGVLRWPLKEIAQAAGCNVALIKALVTKGVLKGADSRLEEPFIYVPRSGRKDGDPVELLPTQDGPIWYSSRMVKDEYVRANAGASTRFGAESNDNQAARKPKPDSDRAKLRARVLEKTGGNCYHCSTRLGDRWEIDHLMPRSKGGRHTFANLVPSCVACNQDKSDTMPDDWDALSRSPNNAPSRRHGEAKGDGSSSSSSSSIKDNPLPPAGGGWVRPDWVPEDPWQAFEEIRRKRKKPLTDRARGMAVAKLDALRAGGHDPQAVIEQTVLHAWDTFYPLKGGGPGDGASSAANPWEGAK